ncbi:MAG: hypothetical protein QOJ07_3175, partial [Thermoleophilaceae bacterium]|nr:hypothetical protein [Thermoleophilaceae bacterium]
DPRADASRLGLEPAAVARLQRLGERGLSGAFGLDLLAAMPVETARRWLCQQAEVSPFTADLALAAGAGRRDVAPQADPRLIAAVERYYGTNRSQARRRLAELTKRWGEFAGWAAYLLVEAARRDGAWAPISALATS